MHKIIILNLKIFINEHIRTTKWKATHWVLHSQNRNGLGVKRNWMKPRRMNTNQ